MQKNTKILLGVLAVAVVGVGSYLFSTGGLQGRLERFGNKQPAKKISYIESTPLCLKPEEFQKKYLSGQLVMESGRSTEETNTSRTVKAPEIGAGSGNTVTKTEEENYTPEIINYVKCSCERQGFKYITQDDQGKDVINECIFYAPPKCVDPDFICPEGTEMDITALNNLCAAKKKKNCFGAMKADNTSKEDAMCKNLKTYYYKMPVCVSPDECKKYKEWMDAGIFTSNVKKYGLNEGVGSLCDWQEPEIWNKK